MTLLSRHFLILMSLLILAGSTPNSQNSTEYVYYMAGQPNYITASRFHAAVAITSTSDRPRLEALLNETYLGTAQMLHLKSWGHVLVRVPEQSIDFELAGLLSKNGFQIPLTFSSHEKDGRETWPKVILPELRVRFKDPVQMSDVLNTLKKQGLAVKWQRGDRDVMLKARSSQQALTVAAQLFESGLAEFSYPNFLFKIAKTMTPNDTYLSDQWHFDNIGAKGAWDINTGLNTVTIAIIDDGTDTSHADLAASLVPGLDVIGDGYSMDNDPRPSGDDAHGTATAGLAAGIGNNSRGISGVCQHCKIMPIRIMDSTSYSSAGTTEDAFYYARTNGAHILSNSWGPMPPIDSNLFPDGLKAEISTAVNENKIVLFAAGNETNPLVCPGGVPWEPAAYSESIAIGASSYYDELESYSNFSGTNCPVTIVSPAASVTTDITGSRGYNSYSLGTNDYTDTFAGTSAATPVAAGAVGVLLSIDPTLTWGQILSVLKSSADKIGGVTYNQSGFNTYYGWGRLNLYRAANFVKNGTLCEPEIGGETSTEACSDTIDNDCDALIDAQDPSCAPDDVAVGSSCEDGCGVTGKFCLSSLPDGGYCTMYCLNGTSCNTGDVCLACGCDTGAGHQTGCDCDPDGCACDSTPECDPQSSQNQNACDCDPDCNLCLDGCLKHSDCRAGYVCLYVTDTARACYPDCAHDGLICENGDTCNSRTGLCEHDGSSPVGGACDTDQECSANGYCIGSDINPDPDWPSGYCTPECGDNDACPTGSICTHFTSVNFCFDKCTLKSDCRTGYGCWQGLAESERICFPQCSASDCSGENETCCPATGGCESDTLCEELTCDCDTEPTCQSGCECDPNCDPANCTCNTDADCQTDCDCDIDCIPTDCTCDHDRSCDVSCACDPHCPCDCDETTKCDDFCTCDPECLNGDSEGCGCNSQKQPASLIWIILPVMFSRWRRRLLT